MMLKVLVADKVGAAAVDIFRAKGIEVIVEVGLSERKTLQVRASAHRDQKESSKPMH